MKSANEGFCTCSMFQENLRGFIDDELTEDIKAEFLSHAAHCEICNTSLKDSRRLKKLLGILTPVKVSPEFDFRVKGRIRLETIRLQNPIYRFRLFIQENMKTFLTVPTAAVIILAVVFSSSEVNYNQNNQAEITQNTVSITNKNLVSTVVDSSEEVIHYVLDSIKPGEAEMGIFLNGQNNSIPVTSTNPDIKLISF